MNIESKFIFISRFFILLFCVINLTYLIPVNVFDISYYLNFSTAIVDTSTLLILGLAVPKYIYLKKLQRYKESNTNIDSFTEEIEIINMKSFYNSKISYFLSIFFALVVFIQPLNIIFTLNKNDIYTSSMIQMFNNRLKIETQKIEKEFNLTNQESSTNEETSQFDERKNILKKFTEQEIDNFLEKNNKNIFNKIKFIIRNLIMALIWTMVFYKLSVL